MDNTIQERNPRRYDKTYKERTSRNNISTQVQRKYAKANDNNVGVFQGAAISPLMFTMYLDDMMEDLEALKRTTNLLIRMIQDRPHQQQEELLLEEIKKSKNMRNAW